MVIVSQCAIVRRGLAAVVGDISGANRVAVVGAPIEAIRYVAGDGTALVTVDVGGYEAHTAARVVSELISLKPGTRVMVFAPPTDAAAVHCCLNAGALAWVSPSSDESIIKAAATAALCGQRFVDPGIAHALTLPRRAEGGADAAHLTPRERDVLRLLAEGCSNRDISTRLTITEKTVKGHVSSIFAKLNVTSRLAAGLKASSIL